MPPWCPRNVSPRGALFQTAQARLAQLYPRRARGEVFLSTVCQDKFLEFLEDFTCAQENLRNPHVAPELGQWYIIRA